MVEKTSALALTCYKDSTYKALFSMRVEEAYEISRLRYASLKKGRIE